MRTHEPFEDGDLQALMENLPMSKSTPENLKAKLYDMAASPAPRRRAVRRPALAFAFGGALVAVAVAVMISLPATAKSWSLIKQAVQRVETMEMQIRELDGTSGTTRIGFAPGTILVQPDSGEIVYISQGTVQIYDKSENVVREFPMPMAEMIPDIKNEVLREISMSKMLQEYEQEYGRQNMKIGPFRNLDGRRVYDVALNNPKESEHAVLVVDADTDLPVLIEAYKAGRKTTEIRARYNGAVPADSLKPKFPAGAKFEKFDISKLMEEGKKGGSPPPFDNDNDDEP